MHKTIELKRRKNEAARMKAAIDQGHAGWKAAQAS